VHQIFIYFNVIECSCDRCGTEVCDHFSGSCQCKTNVVGRDCDKCAPDHWGFKSCYGCRQCNCQIASEGTNCDDETGIESNNELIV
jgi:laminin alpha 3/5